MFKLATTSFAVAIILTGLVVVLYMLPNKIDCLNRPDAQAGPKKEKCKDENGMKETRTVKEWKDKDGKMHKEIQIEIVSDGAGACGGPGEMKGGCKEHGDMRGECGPEGGMPMGGCCCCGKMQMHGGMMDHCEMKKDSVVLDTTVRIKIRGKI